MTGPEVLSWFGRWAVSAAQILQAARLGPDHPGRAEAMQTRCLGPTLVVGLISLKIGTQITLIDSQRLEPRFVELIFQPQIFKLLP